MLSGVRIFAKIPIRFVRSNKGGPYVRYAARYVPKTGSCYCDEQLRSHAVMSSLQRKRPASTVSVATVQTRSRGQATGVSIGAARFVSVKADPGGVAPGGVAPGSVSVRTNRDQLKEEFIQLFSNPTFRCTNAALKNHFGDTKYLELAPIINELIQSSRLTMSKIGDDLLYTLVSDELAFKFSGLDTSAKMVYQVIQSAGNMGIWTKDIRTQTNIQQQSLTKIFKTLESRQLIKPVKSVNAKAKKLYMLYNLTPAKELTGGPWYTELEFDHEFINELRNFVLLCVQKMNSGKGVTLAEIAEKMKQAKVSRVELNQEEVQQLLQTLAFDFKTEQSGVDRSGNALFVSARKVTPLCEFKWWPVLTPDFRFRDLKFEDGVILKAHEPHYHTA